MQDGKFRSIKKTSRAIEVESHKVASLRVAVSQGSVLVGGTESSVECIETAGRFALIQAGASHRIDHQARLIAIFGGSRSRYDFQRLNGIYWDLCRESFTLLIRDRLVIQ